MVTVKTVLAEEPSVWTRWGPSGRGVISDAGRKWSSAGTPVAGSYVRWFAYCGNGIVVGGSNSGHIARSTDYGFTWKDLGVPIAGCTAVYKVVYIGNGILMANAVDATGGRIIRSTDYGITWTANSVVVNSVFGAGNPGVIVYCGNGIVLVFDSAAYLYRSTDYGVTFSWISQMATAGVPNGGCYCGNGIVVTAGSTYFHRSTDYGLTWKEAALPTDLITVGFAYPNYLGNGRIALFAMGGYPAVSTDYGITWRMAATTGVSGMNCYGATDCGGGHLVGSQRSSSGATDTIHLSDDWGESWYNPDIGVGTETNIYSACHLENGIVIVCAVSGVVYRSTPFSKSEFDVGQKDMTRIQCTANSTTVAAGADYGMLVVSAAATKTITLPKATYWAGRRLIIKNATAAQDVLITGAASGATTQRIDATTTVTQATVYNADELMSSGTRWIVIKRYR